MYPVETVMEFGNIFEFVKLGWAVSVVAFFIIFFICFGISILINVFKQVAK